MVFTVLCGMEKMLSMEASIVELAIAVLTRGQGWICSALLCAQLECRATRRRQPSHRGRAGQPSAKRLSHWKTWDSQEGYKAMITEDTSSASHYLHQPVVAAGSAVTSV